MPAAAALLEASNIIIPKEINFSIEFCGKEHLKSNEIHSFVTLEEPITCFDEEKVIWEGYWSKFKNVHESIICTPRNPNSPSIYEKSQKLV